MKRAALCVVLLAYGATYAVLLHVHVPHGSLWLLLASVLGFLLAVALLARSGLAPRHMALLVVLVGAALQVIAVSRAPQTSDDVYRYVWDAKVQLSGIDPYRYAPDSRQLLALRDHSLFGPSSPCTYPIPHGCTAINRPQVHTIYPPVAEAAFTVVRVASWGKGGVLPYQLIAALGAVAISAFLARRVLRLNERVWPVAVWAWCPLVVTEFGNNAHLDWLIVLLCLLAVDAASQHRAVLAGGLLGAAIATKLYPALLLPALMRRRPLLVAATSVAFVVLVYLPHLLLVGRAVVGYLPGYLSEEGYQSGRRLLLVGLVLPQPADTLAGAAILVAVVGYAWRRMGDDVAAAATVVVGTALLVATPTYGWYAALLLAMAIMASRLEWIPVALAPSFVYIVRVEVDHHAWLSRIIYTAAAALTLWLWYARRRRERSIAVPCETASVT